MSSAASTPEKSNGFSHRTNGDSGERTVQNHENSIGIFRNPRTEITTDIREELSELVNPHLNTYDEDPKAAIIGTIRSVCNYFGVYDQKDSGRFRELFAAANQYLKENTVEGGSLHDSAKTEYQALVKEYFSDDENEHITLTALSSLHNKKPSSRGSLSKLNSLTHAAMRRFTVMLGIEKGTIKVEDINQPALSQEHQS